MTTSRHACFDPYLSISARRNNVSQYHISLQQVFFYYYYFYYTSQHTLRTDGRTLPRMNARESRYAVAADGRAVVWRGKCATRAGAARGGMAQGAAVGGTGAVATATTGRLNRDRRAATTQLPREDATEGPPRWLGSGVQSVAFGSSAAASVTVGDARALSGGVAANECIVWQPVEYHQR